MPLLSVTEDDLGRRVRQVHRPDLTGRIAALHPVEGWTIVDVFDGECCLARNQPFQLHELEWDWEADFAEIIATFVEAPTAFERFAEDMKALGERS